MSQRPFAPQLPLPPPSRGRQRAATLAAAAAAAALAHGGVGLAQATPRPFAPHVDAESVHAQVRWRLGTTVRWMLREGAGPANSRALATRAINEVAAATGLPFRYAGITDELRPELLSATSPTIVIGFATAAELSELRGAVAGVGGVIVASSARTVPLAGMAIVDANASLSPDFGPGSSVGSVLLHELGHAMGLAHSPNRTSIMYRVTVPGLAARFSNEDLARLAAVVDRRA